MDPKNLSYILKRGKASVRV